MAKLEMPPCRNNLCFEQQAPGSNHCHEHATNNTLGFCIATPETHTDRKEKKRKAYAKKVTPVCVNLGRSLHLVHAPGKFPPSN